MKKGNEKLTAFVLQHARYLTISDMAEEMGISEYIIRDIVKTIGLTPIKAGQQTKEYILNVYKKVPKKTIAARIGYSVNAIDNLYRELEIKEPDWSEKPKWVSPREILSTLRCVGANHYQPGYDTYRSPLATTNIKKPKSKNEDLDINTDSEYLKQFYVEADLALSKKKNKK